MSNIYVRQTTLDDLPKAMETIAGTKKTLSDNGVDQWQQGYPNEEIVKQDIEEDIGFSLILDGEIVGGAALQQGYDKDFQDMIDGAWDSESDVTYAIIRRLSVNEKGKRFCSDLIENLLTISHYLGYSDVRTDVHPDNLEMKRIITDCGFVEKGTIRVARENDKRIAYQILLK